jgi:hypothetical protein
MTMTRTSNRAQGAIMLNGKSYQEHFADYPAFTAPTCPRAPYSAELLEVLAALEDELRIIVRQTARPAPRSGLRQTALKFLRFALVAVRGGA